VIAGRSERAIPWRFFHKENLMKTTALCLALILLFTAGAWAGTEKVLYAFCSQQNCADGAYPYAGVISDNEHNLYGTTAQGGDNFAGLVYELKHTKSGWKESVLYKFSGGADGAAPTGQLLFDGKGNLYGIANGGGAGYGTVYELTPSKGGWAFNVIHTFQGGNDGIVNIGVSGLVLDKAGHLYGVTEMGGTAGYGTVFKLARSGSGWKKTTLYSFAGGTDAADPLMGLTWNSAGNLYGATVGGGAYGCGAVFELKHQKKTWSESVVYSFTGGSDGCWPEFGSVTIPKSGGVYGTTGAGGSANQGVVYQLKLSNGTWNENTLYDFTGGNDGGQVFAGVTFDPAGNIFGAAAYYGPSGYGTVVELAKQKSGWQEKTVHQFTGSDGGYPYGNIMVDAKGNLYGTTFRGGNLGCNQVQQGCGVVFEMKP
jgi:uncharacterized repeat protein (TIGR03803 family)